MSRMLILLVGSTLVVAPLAAQGHALEGTWNLSYPAGARVEPDGPETIMGKAELEVSAKGDSLIGTLTPEAVAGMPARPPARLAGLAREGKVTFVVRSKAQLHLNGEAREVTVVSTWIISANGDALSGTVERRFEDADDLPLPQNGAEPVNGTRRK